MRNFRLVAFILTIFHLFSMGGLEALAPSNKILEGKKVLSFSKTEKNSVLASSFVNHVQLYVPQKLNVLRYVSRLTFESILNHPSPAYDLTFDIGENRLNLHFKDSQIDFKEGFQVLSGFYRGLSFDSSTLSITLENYDHNIASFNAHFFRFIGDYFARLLVHCSQMSPTYQKQIIQDSLIKFPLRLHLSQISPTAIKDQNQLFNTLGHPHDRNTFEEDQLVPGEEHYALLTDVQTVQFFHLVFENLFLVLLMMLALCVLFFNTLGLGALISTSILTVFLGIVPLSVCNYMLTKHDREFSRKAFDEIATKNASQAVHLLTRSSFSSHSPSSIIRTLREVFFCSSVAGFFFLAFAVITDMSFMSQILFAFVISASLVFTILTTALYFVFAALDNSYTVGDQLVHRKKEQGGLISQSVSENYSHTQSFKRASHNPWNRVRSALLEVLQTVGTGVFLSILIVMTDGVMFNPVLAELWHYLVLFCTIIGLLFVISYAVATYTNKTVALKGALSAVTVGFFMLFVASITAFIVLQSLLFGMIALGSALVVSASIFLLAFLSHKQVSPDIENHHSEPLEDVQIGDQESLENFEVSSASDRINTATLALFQETFLAEAVLLFLILMAYMLDPTLTATPLLAIPIGLFLLSGAGFLILYCVLYRKLQKSKRLQASQKDSYHLLAYEQNGRKLSLKGLGHPVFMLAFLIFIAMIPTALFLNFYYFIPIFLASAVVFATLALRYILRNKGAVKKWAQSSASTTVASSFLICLLFVVAGINFAIVQFVDSFIPYFIFAFFFVVTLASVSLLTLFKKGFALQKFTYITVPFIIMAVIVAGFFIVAELLPLSGEAWRATVLFVAVLIGMGGLPFGLGIWGLYKMARKDLSHEEASSYKDYQPQGLSAQVSSDYLNRQPLLFKVKTTISSDINLTRSFPKRLFPIDWLQSLKTSLKGHTQNTYNLLTDVGVFNFLHLVLENLFLVLLMMIALCILFFDTLGLGALITTCILTVFLGIIPLAICNYFLTRHDNEFVKKVFEEQAHRNLNEALLILSSKDSLQHSPSSLIRTTKEFFYCLSVAAFFFVAFAFVANMAEFMPGFLDIIIISVGLVVTLASIVFYVIFACIDHALTTTDHFIHQSSSTSDLGSLLLSAYRNIEIFSSQPTALNRSSRLKSALQEVFQTLGAGFFLSVLIVVTDGLVFTPALTQFWYVLVFAIGVIAVLIGLGYLIASNTDETRYMKTVFIIAGVVSFSFFVASSLAIVFVSSVALISLFVTLSLSSLLVTSVCILFLAFLFSKGASPDLEDTFKKDEETDGQSSLAFSSGQSSAFERTASAFLTFLQETFLAEAVMLFLILMAYIVDPSLAVSPVLAIPVGLFVLSAVIYTIIYVFAVHQANRGKNVEIKGLEKFYSAVYSQDGKKRYLRGFGVPLFLFFFLMFIAVIPTALFLSFYYFIPIFVLAVIILGAVVLRHWIKKHQPFSRWRHSSSFNTMISSFFVASLFLFAVVAFVFNLTAGVNSLYSYALYATLVLAGLAGLSIVFILKRKSFSIQKVAYLLVPFISMAILILAFMLIADYIPLADTVWQQIVLFSAVCFGLGSLPLALGVYCIYAVAKKDRSTKNVTSFKDFTHKDSQKKAPTTPHSNLLTVCESHENKHDFYRKFVDELHQKEESLLPHRTTALFRSNVLERYNLYRSCNSQKTPSRVLEKSAFIAFKELESSTPPYFLGTSEESHQMWSSMHQLFLQMNQDLLYCYDSSAETLEAIRRHYLSHIAEIYSRSDCSTHDSVFFVIDQTPDKDVDLDQFKIDIIKELESPSEEKSPVNIELFQFVSVNEDPNVNFNTFSEKMNHVCHLNSNQIRTDDSIVHFIKLGELFSVESVRQAILKTPQLIDQYRLLEQRVLDLAHQLRIGVSFGSVSFSINNQGHVDIQRTQIYYVPDSHLYLRPLKKLVVNRETDLGEHQLKVIPLTVKDDTISTVVQLVPVTGHSRFNIEMTMKNIDFNVLYSSQPIVFDHLLGGNYFENDSRKSVVDRLSDDSYFYQVSQLCQTDSHPDTDVQYRCSSLAIDSNGRNVYQAPVESVSSVRLDLANNMKNLSVDSDSSVPQDNTPQVLLSYYLLLKDKFTKDSQEGRKSHIILDGDLFSSLLIHLIKSNPQDFGSASDFPLIEQFNLSVDIVESIANSQPPPVRRLFQRTLASDKNGYYPINSSTYQPHVVSDFPYSKITAEDLSSLDTTDVHLFIPGNFAKNELGLIQYISDASYIFIDVSYLEAMKALNIQDDDLFSNKDKLLYTIVESIEKGRHQASYPFKELLKMTARYMHHSEAYLQSVGRKSEQVVRLALHDLANFEAYLDGNEKFIDDDIYKRVEKELLAMIIFCQTHRSGHPQIPYTGAVESWDRYTGPLPSFEAVIDELHLFKLRFENPNYDAQIHTQTVGKMISHPVPHCIQLIDFDFLRSANGLQVEGHLCQQSA